MSKNRIALLRKEKHMSQSQLAKEANLSRQAVSLYEIGKREPKLETWESIASVFDVSVGYLQGISDRKKDKLTNSELKKALNEALTSGELNTDLVKNIQATVIKSNKIISNAHKGRILQATSLDKLSNYSKAKILFLVSVSNLVLNTDNDEFKNLSSVITELNIFMNQLNNFATKNNDPKIKNELLEPLINIISEINSNF